MSLQDPQVGLAIETLRKHFTNKIGQVIKTPFYQSQLEIFYEDVFHPWVIGNALKELIEEGFLEVVKGKEMKDFSKLKNIQTINFFIPREVVKKTEDRERIEKRILNISEYVDRYSDPKNSKVLGKHLENIVKAELRAFQFKIVGEHTNEYYGVKWTETDHNLDFIAVHYEGKLKIGVEVKNTLNLMNPKEIDVKIEICEKLGLTPVFAIRWMRPYMECIRLQGGFSWVFKTQMYPLGYEKMVDELYQKLSAVEKTDTRGHRLDFPITVRTELTKKIRAKFENWVNSIKDNPPTLNTKYRCKHHKREAEIEV